MDESKQFQLVVQNNMKVVFPRAEAVEVLLNKVKRGFIGHITVHDQEYRVVDGEIITVKVKRNLIVEQSKKDDEVYYIFDAIEGTFRIQLMYKS